jgi:aspartate carbamoyltransferase catalytic subunit
LGLEDFSAEEIGVILDRAEWFRREAEAGRRRHTLLEGKTSANLLFEDSTRTRNSFSLAAQRLGMDIIEFSPVGSSLSKGESLLDTARNIEAMGVEAVVVRHRQAGVPHMLAQHLKAAVINAGDGPHEHPTQALLDLMTVRQKKGRVEGLTVALIGDIAHSRAARSNIWGLKTLGARVIVCGPEGLVSPQWAEQGVEFSHDLDAIVPRIDVFNVLRIQFERHDGTQVPSVEEYTRRFALDEARLSRAKPDALVIAPGPINRGVEITDAVADGPQSAILQQVANGVFVRMAVLWLLAGG